MKIDQFVYLNEGDLNEPIYRIFQLKWFNQLLEDEENTLVKPLLWDDPYENYILNHKVSTQQGPANNMSRNFIHGQCWTLKNESDALWRIYSNNKDGIKVKTTIKKLFKSFYQGCRKYTNQFCFIGKVQYDNELLFNQLQREFENSQGYSIDGSLEAKTFLHKRELFSYEEEIRIISFRWEKGADKLLKIPCKPLELIDKIILHPEMNIEKANQLTSKYFKYGFDKNSIKQSTLHKLSKEKLRVLQLNKKH